MKSLLVSITVLLSSLSAAAQTEQGAWLLGGSSNLSFVSYTPTSGGSNQSYFNFGLKAGYFAAPDFVIGANFEILNIDAPSGSGTITTIGGFLRFYTVSRIFLGAGYNSLAPDSGDSVGSIPFEIGYAGFVTRKFAIEPSIMYTIATDSDAGGMPGYAGLPFPAKSSIGFRVGFTLYLGDSED